MREKPSSIRGQPMAGVRFCGQPVDPVHDHGETSAGRLADRLPQRPQPIEAADSAPLRHAFLAPAKRQSGDAPMVSPRFVPLDVDTDTAATADGRRNDRPGMGDGEIAVIGRARMTSARPTIRLGLDRPIGSPRCGHEERLREPSGGRPPFERGTAAISTKPAHVHECDPHGQPGQRGSHSHCKHQQDGHQGQKSSAPRLASSPASAKVRKPLTNVSTGCGHLAIM